MAIALGTGSSNGGTSTGSGTSHTKSNTITGSNMTLIVGAMYFDGTGTDIISGMTYGGTAMTKLNASDNTSNAYYSSLWILENAPAGTADVVASYSSSSLGSYLTIASFSDTATTQSAGVLGASQTNTSTVTISETTTVDNSYVFSFHCGNRTNTAGTGSTEIVGSANSLGNMFADTDNPITPAGSMSYIVNAATGAYNGNHWLALEPFVAATGFNSARRHFMMGM